MEIDAALQRFEAEAAAKAAVVIAIEQKHRHLNRTALPQRQPIFACLGLQTRRADAGPRPSFARRHQCRATL